MISLKVITMPENVSIDLEPLRVSVMDLNQTISAVNTSVNEQLTALNNSIDVLTAVSIGMFILLFVAMSIKFLFSRG